MAPSAYIVRQRSSSWRGTASARRSRRTAARRRACDRARVHPTEVWAAPQAGSSIIKLFPLQFHGASYVRELRGPFEDLPLLACGGIRQDNLREYLEAGAEAVALGASTFRREWLASGNVAALTGALSGMDSVVQACHAKRLVSSRLVEA